MKFSKRYSKLEKDVFTTIRKNVGYYMAGKKVRIDICGNEGEFWAEVLYVKEISKADITDEIALADADCMSEDLIALLERFYGPDFDDFILIKLRKL